MLLIKDKIHIEAPNLRLYTLLCIHGHGELSEVEALNEMVCSECGGQVFRVCRDINAEKMQLFRCQQGETNA